GGSSPAHSSRDPVHHLVVHRTAMLRMRMADQRGLARRLILGFFEQRFDFPGWTIDKKRFDPAGHSDRSIIRELHVDAEILAAQQPDDLLKGIAVAAGDADQIALNGSLHLFLTVLYSFHDLAGLLDGNALL